MMSVGVDMIEVSRIQRGIDRFGQRFNDRFFTRQEQDYCQQDARRLAGRFAVKEAVAKALGTGIGDVRWIDIEVLAGPRGKPDLILHGSAVELAEDLGIDHWAISLSHTEELAIGFAVASG